MCKKRETCFAFWKQGVSLSPFLLWRGWPGKRMWWSPAKKGGSPVKETDPDAGNLHQRRSPSSSKTVQSWRSFENPSTCWRKHCRSRNILTSHFIFSLSNSHRKLQHSQFRRLTYICFLIVLMHTYEFVMISFWSWWKHIFYFHVEVLWLRQKTFAVHQNWQKNKWNCRGEVKYARLLLGFNIFVSRYDIAFRCVVIFCILLHFTACERETVCSKLFDAYYWFWKTNYKMYSQVALYIL